MALTPALLGRDLAALSTHLGLTDYSLVGYCSGAASIFDAWPHLSTRPSRLMFVSVPASGGETFRAEKVVKRLATDPRMREVVLDIAATSVPAPLRRQLIEELQHPGCLEKILEHMNESRRFSFPTDFGPPVPSAFVLAEQEFPGIRSGTEQYIQQLDPRLTSLIDEPNSTHFFPNEQPKRFTEVLLGFLLNGKSFASEEYA